MTAQEVIELAGHRDVPPWVMKLVADCVAREREECLVILQNRMFSREGVIFAIRARGQQST